MVFCPNCGEEIPDDSSFCQKCGTNLNEASENKLTNKTSTNLSVFDKNIAILILGYIALIVDLIAIIYGCGNVKVINADRLVLYPFLGFMLVFFASIEIAKTEKYVIHSYILVIISIILLVIFG